jgi:hypothetical protein
MTYLELQTLFRQRLNRRDITQALVETFIQGAIQRTQRLLRTPGSEVATEITFGELDDTIAIPGDYLGMVSMLVGESNELARVNLSEALRLSRVTGIPTVYARNRDQFVIGPKPYPGDIITIVYHANFAILAGPDDSNWLTEIAPDVIIDGALSKACQHFADPRKDTFEATYTQAIIDMNLQAQDDELFGAVVGSGDSLDFWGED